VASSKWGNRMLQEEYQSNIPAAILVAYGVRYRRLAGAGVCLGWFP